VIKSFADKKTAEIWSTGKAHGSPLAAVARRKLSMVDAALELDDLRTPPGNRLEKLKGGRQGQHRIRINDQYRICFIWRGHDAHDVEITDYQQAFEVMKYMARESIVRKGTPNWRVHPGAILREEFLKPLGMSPYELAKRLRVPVPRVNDIVLERRGISADTAVRLSRFFGTADQFWLSLQAAYEIGGVKAELGEEIALIKPRASSTPG